MSVTLLKNLKPFSDDDELYERIMLDLLDDRGTYKRTVTNRFREFDSQSVEIVSEKFSKRTETLFIHDAAVSDARTSVDFFHALSCSIEGFDFLATDYDPTLKVIRSGSLTVTLSRNNIPIEVTYPPFVLTSCRRDKVWLFPINYLLKYVLGKTKVKMLVRRYSAGDIYMSNVESIELFCPAALRLSASADNFHLGAYDIMDEPDFLHPFGCVRIMNALNRAYFDDKQMAVVLRNLYDSLEYGGILIAGSNQEAESPVHGGIFEKKEHGFEQIMRAGDNDFLMNHIRQFVPN